MLPNLNTSTDKKSQSLIAALYARVSTARQEDQETIDSQIDEIKGRIEADGNILLEGNIFQDDGWTGEMLQRPGLDAMRDAAQAGSFQVLYVYDRGRLSRVFAYQEIIIEELTDFDVKFITLHDIKAETAEEKVLQAMQGVFHEYERVKIVERMRRGKLFKARNGVLINGHSLYGYDYIKKTDKEAAHYQVNEEQARVVKMVFDWVGNERVSLREVIKRLYDMGIPPRKGKSEFWTKGPLVRLLQCETYTTGSIFYNKSESVVAKNPIKHDKYKKIKRTSRRERPREDWIPFQVPTLLDDIALFERVQKILDHNKRYSTKNRKNDYLLSGLVHCGCGNIRAGDGSNKYGHYYYRCAERIYKLPSEERRCQIPGTNAVILDGLTWKELVKFLKDPDTLKKHVSERLKERQAQTVDVKEKMRLSEAVNKIDEEEKRYSKAYGAAALSFEQFMDLMKDARKRKLALQAKLAELNLKLGQDELSQITEDDVYREVNATISKIDYSNKAKTVRDIIDKVIIKEGGWVNICGHIPLFTQKLGYEPTSRYRRFT